MILRCRTAGATGAAAGARTAGTTRTGRGRASSPSSEACSSVGGGTAASCSACSVSAAGASAKAALRRELCRRGVAISVSGRLSLAQRAPQRPYSCGMRPLRKVGIVLPRSPNSSLTVSSLSAVRSRQRAGGTLLPFSRRALLPSSSAPLFSKPWATMRSWPKPCGSCASAPSRPRQRSSSDRRTRRRRRFLRPPFLPEIASSVRLAGVAAAAAPGREGSSRPCRASGKVCLCVRGREREKREERRRGEERKKVDRSMLFSPRRR